MLQMSVDVVDKSKKLRTHNLSSVNSRCLQLPSSKEHFKRKKKNIRRSWKKTQIWCMMSCPNLRLFSSIFLCLSTKQINCFRISVSNLWQIGQKHTRSTQSWDPANQTLPLCTQLRRQESCRSKNEARGWSCSGTPISLWLSAARLNLSIQMKLSARSCCAQKTPTTSWSQKSWSKLC